MSIGFHAVAIGLWKALNPVALMFVTVSGAQPVNANAMATTTKMDIVRMQRDIGTPLDRARRRSRNGHILP
jgi:hypothetical protein